MSDDTFEEKSDKAELKKYRWHLIEARQKADESSTKYILTISGGAIAISLTFLNGLPENASPLHSILIVLAWISWTLAIILTFISFSTSKKSLEKAIEQTDDGTIYDGNVGGCYSTATKILNASSSLFFIVGLILLIIFAIANMR